MKLLNNVKIIDLTKLLPGPFCTMILADLGAEVIKIEHPDPMKDMARFTPPFIKGDKSRVATLFYQINRNKKSMTLDFTRERGREILLDLIKDADVLVESFKPGTLERWGLGMDVLRKTNPELIACSISGYGQDGPRSREPGHDLNYMSLAGMNYLLGAADSPPGCYPLPFGDFIGALYAAIGILSSLYWKLQKKLGEDQALGGNESGFLHVDSSIFESILSLYPLMLKPSGTFKKGEMVLSGMYPFYKIYECKDGKFLSIGAIEQKFWNRFCDAVQHPEWKDEQFSGIKYVEEELGLKSKVSHEEITRELKAIFLERNRDEWVEYLTASGVCCTPILDINEVWDDKHVKQRHFRVLIDDPIHGKFMHLRSPLLFNGETLDIRPMPAPGEHNNEILKKLGIDEDELRKLKRKRII
ncbi:MAG: CaiB/BaiF CoA transferase family protein [Promethearchaeota archaeon]